MGKIILHALVAAAAISSGIGSIESIIKKTNE